MVAGLVGTEEALEELLEVLEELVIVLGGF